MSEENKYPKATRNEGSDGQTASGSGSGTTRRRLIKQAALAAPALFTVSGKPALAATQCTISGQLSGNLSGPQVSCEGCSPGYWKQTQNFGNWIAPYSPVDPKTKWTDVFPPFPGMPSDLTLIDALCLSGDIHKNLAKQAVAALLNGAYARANPGFNFGYTDGEVVDLYEQYYMTDPDLLLNSLDMINNQGCTLGPAYLPGHMGTGPGCSHGSHHPKKKHHHK